MSQGKFAAAFAVLLLAHFWGWTWVALNVIDFHGDYGAAWLETAALESLGVSFYLAGKFAD